MSDILYWIYTTAMTEDGQVFLLLLIGAIVLISILIACLVEEKRKRCPSCKKPSARVFRYSKIIDEWAKEGTKLLKDTVRDAEGRIIRTIDREIPKTYHFIERVYKYECKFCGHRWSKTKVE